MKFTTLGQTTYKDDNGNTVSSELVEFISPYHYICDGFYEWECGNCKVKHASRGCGPIAGQVLKCSKCGYSSLLVKTNTVELDKFFGKSLELAQREKDIEAKEKKLTEYIPKSQWEQMVKILKKVSEFNKQFGTEIGNCIQGLDV